MSINHERTIKEGTGVILSSVLHKFRKREKIELNVRTALYLIFLRQNDKDMVHIQSNTGEVWYFGNVKENKVPFELEEQVSNMYFKRTGSDYLLFFIEFIDSTLESLD